MSQQGLNRRQRKERWDQAVALAKKGQYSKASYMLSGMEDDPKVQKLLNQMEGRKDKLQGGLTQFFSMTLIVLVSVGAIVIWLVFNSVMTLQNEQFERDAVRDEYTNRSLQINGGVNYWTDLVYMCYESVGENTPSCYDWTQTVVTDYDGVVRSCVLISETDGIQNRGRTNEQLLTCFFDNGIPATPQT